MLQVASPPPTAAQSQQREVPSLELLSSAVGARVGLSRAAVREPCRVPAWLWCRITLHTRHTGSTSDGPPQ